MTATRGGAGFFLGLVPAGCVMGLACAANAGPCGTQSPWGTVPAYFQFGQGQGPFFESFPPPVNNQQTNATYAPVPITDSAAQGTEVANCTTWSGHTWYFLWANRSTYNIPNNPDVNKAANPIYPAINYTNIPNGPSATNVKLEYTLVNRAGAATEAEMLYLLGAPLKKWQAPLVSSGICAANPCTSSEAISWADLSVDSDGDPNNWFKNNLSADGKNFVMVDKMLIPSGQLSSNTATNSYGVVIDWEVQDFRVSANTDLQLDKLGQDLASYGRKSYLYTNPFDGADLTANGFSLTTMNDIESNFDYVGLYALTGPPSSCHSFPGTYANSISYLKGVSGEISKGYGEIVVMVDLSLCSPSDTLEMYQQRATDHFGGFYIFPDGVTMGGTNPATGGNSVIYPLVFGTLPP